MIPVDVVPGISAGRLVTGIWKGQSWPQQDYVITILYATIMCIMGSCGCTHLEHNESWLLQSEPWQDPRGDNSITAWVHCGHRQPFPSVWARTGSGWACDIDTHFPHLMDSAAHIRVVINFDALVTFTYYEGAWLQVQLTLRALQVNQGF